MNNISWGKTVGNWGANKDLSECTKDQEQKELIILSFEEKLNSKNEIIDICDELINKSETFYDVFSNKELYDAIVTLKSAKSALNKIFIKEDKKEINKV